MGFTKTNLSPRDVYNDPDHISYAENEKEVLSLSWKWDVTIHDRPGWRSDSNNHQRLHLLPDGQLGVQIWSTQANRHSNDYWKEHLDDRELISSDGGETWHTAEASSLPPQRAVRTPNGKLISIWASEIVRPMKERKEHRERNDLGGFYNEDWWYQHTLWPASAREGLIADGLHVADIPEGLIATIAGLTQATSTDNGATWEYRDITHHFPFHASQIGFFREPIVSRAGTILGPSDGRYNPAREPAADIASTVYCLRSRNDGESWEMITVARDITGVHDFSEGQIIELPSGRILMMMRHAGKTMSDRHLYQSSSDDDGQTWSQAKETPIWGYPPHLLQLRSGALLCTYTHRRPPYGIRGCLSYDEGRTWNIDNEIIIRDDSVHGGISYPTAVQLDDDSIFVAYGVNKRSDSSPPEEVIDDIPARRYVAGSRFTEDYVGS